MCNRTATPARRWGGGSARPVGGPRYSCENRGARRGDWQNAFAVNDPQVDPRPELGSLFGLEGQLEPRPWRRIVATTVLVHVALALVLLEAPLFEGRSLRSSSELVVSRNHEPIFAPVMEPSQPAPNNAHV